MVRLVLELVKCFFIRFLQKGVNVCVSYTGLLVQVEMWHGQIEYRLIETVPVSQSSRTSYSIC